MITKLLIFVFSLSTFALHAQIIDVVFDLDWTLVYPLPGKPPSHMKNVIFVEADQKYYRITDWASEVLAQLHRKPDIRISFFSGGEQIRNVELLKQIKISDNKTALDIAYKIRSFDDLMVVEADPSLRFADRLKKELTLINFDLRRVILIDDSYQFTMPDQHRNQLWLGDTYNFYETADEIPQVKDKYDPPNMEKWARERKKLLSVYAVIEELYKN